MRVRAGARRGRTLDVRAPEVTAFWRQRAERERASIPRSASVNNASSTPRSPGAGWSRRRRPRSGDRRVIAHRAGRGPRRRSEVDETRSPHTRPAARRRARRDLRGWLDNADRARVGGERPHVTVTITADQLARGGEAELDHSGPIDGTIASGSHATRRSAGRYVGEVRAARRRQKDTGGPGVHASSGDRPRQDLPIPRM